MADICDNFYPQAMVDLLGAVVQPKELGREDSVSILPQ